MLPVYIGAGVSVSIVLLMLVLKLTKKKNIKTRDAEIVEDVNHIQDYSNFELDTNNDAPFEKDDIFVPAKVDMKVGKTEHILPGRYVVWSTDETRTTLNIKIGSYIRVLEHGSEIILAEGDTIMPIAVGIILR